MDLATRLFHAAKEGNFKDVKNIAAGKSRRQLKSISKAITDDATPLVIASLKGYLDIVKFLVEHCDAEVEKSGTVISSGYAIDGASPLWCASNSGHLDVVKYLMEHGANVNKTASINSTPLSVACFYGHYDIVKHLILNGADIDIATTQLNTCMMISSYKGHVDLVRLLLEHKADVNKKDVYGRQALHYCAESGHLNISKMLISHGASMEKDHWGALPLFYAALVGHADTVEYLINLKDEKIANRVERIESLELIGAAYINVNEDMIGAIQYWKRAINERARTPCIPKKISTILVPAYAGDREVETIEQLDELLVDPDGMKLQMQALLVRERILPAHPYTTEWIRQRGAVYADENEHDRSLSLYMHAFDMPIQYYDIGMDLTESYHLFIILFFNMMSVSPTKEDNRIRFDDIYKVFSMAINDLEQIQENIKQPCPDDRHIETHCRFVVIMIHFISLICRLKPSLSDEQILKFKNRAGEFLKLNPIGQKGQSALHLAVNPETRRVGNTQFSSFPCLKTVELLIELGAPVYVLDSDGNTPTQIAMQSRDAELILQALEQGNPPKPSFLQSTILNNKDNKNNEDIYLTLP